MAGYALALIGLFNVFGTYTVGLLGQKLAKRKSELLEEVASSGDGSAPAGPQKRARQSRSAASRRS